jgi:hypothetical protein
VQSGAVSAALPGFRRGKPRDVDDLDLMRVAVPPLETDPPLVVRREKGTDLFFQKPGYAESVRTGE